MLLVQRNLGTVGVEGHGGIDGVGTSQAVLGSQIPSLLRQILVEGQESHVGQMRHRRGELLGSRRARAYCSANSRSCLGKRTVSFAVSIELSPPEPAYLDARI